MNKYTVSKTLVLISLIFAGGCSNLKSVYSIDKSSNETDIKVKINNEKLSSKQQEVIFKYSPLVFQNTNKKAKNQSWDFMTSFDFDGDMQANNNEDNLKSNLYKLPATLYYSLIESESHYFITYSIYHPLDWDTLPSFIPYTWHENDMENLQVVVRKQYSDLPEKVVLLATQAHLNTKLMTVKDSFIKSASAKNLNDKDILLLTEDLKENGTHPAIFTESGGHGIHSIRSVAKHFSQIDSPKLKEGFTFTPAKDNLADIYNPSITNYKYQLKSIHDTLWTYYLKHQNIGKNKLMNGTFDYKDELIDYKNIPRHFTSTRVSGPGKSDSGILPFAFSYNLLAKDLGVIFFNPAKKYSETLKIRGKWSKIYTYNPYIKDLEQISHK